MRARKRKYLASVALKAASDDTLVVCSVCGRSHWIRASDHNGKWPNCCFVSMTVFRVSG